MPWLSQSNVKPWAVRNRRRCAAGLLSLAVRKAHTHPALMEVLSWVHSTQVQQLTTACNQASALYGHCIHMQRLRTHVHTHT